MTVSEVARRHGYGRLVGLLAVVALFLTFKLLRLPFAGFTWLIDQVVRFADYCASNLTVPIEEARNVHA